MWTAPLLLRLLFYVRYHKCLPVVLNGIFRSHSALTPCTWHCTEEEE